MNSQVQSMFSDNKEVNEATITADVEMNPSKLMDSLARNLVVELHRVAPNVRINKGEIEQSDIYNYLTTLVWMRVNRCSGDDSKASRPYRILERTVAVPVMAYQLLVMIGVAMDRDFSIKFRPTYSISELNLLAPDQMSELSDVLTRTEGSGMKVVYGLPKEIEGELDFMAMSHVDEVVKSYRHSHPVYGFYASFFAQKQLNEVTGTMCRVLYGYDSDYQLYITQVFQKLNSSSVDN